MTQKCKENNEMGYKWLSNNSQKFQRITKNTTVKKMVQFLSSLKKCSCFLRKLFKIEICLLKCPILRTDELFQYLFSTFYIRRIAYIKDFSKLTRTYQGQTLYIPDIFTRTFKLIEVSNFYLKRNGTMTFNNYEVRLLLC